ncbi:PREDICTED: uncharacterized protein LOC107353211 [Acropora digitifera]|uniref:uncharacterized protein LOC107353211 n=1 Tax=Acropora digitifera TaxID=70779 RepID=UPI00077A9F70|nr:PREDICTED: uncharacterized protein LOC107353211 [Acropora digitifera]
MWKEEKEISTFSFNKSTKEIIDTLMEFLRGGEGDETTIYEYEKEELWFYDGFQSSTEQDFWGEFDVETDISKLNVMICDRIKLIDKILDLCDRLDQHEMRTKYQRIKLTIYRKVLFRPNFVGKGGNEKETIKKAAEQVYRDLGEKERIAELSTSTLESEVKKEEEQKEGQRVSDEEEIVIGFEDETVEQLEEEEEEVVSTSDRESEMASEDENAFLGDFSDTNCESIVLYRGEVIACCFLKQAGIHFIFPPGAVSESRIFTVCKWNPPFRSPPLFENEAVVSDVIELSLDSPGDLHFDKTVTLVIPHCASDLKGYEVVIKCFSSGDEWKDVETADWRTKNDINEDYDLSGYAPDFSFPVAACKITQCSTFAVVCRLKSHRHVVTSQESELIWPEFPLAKVTFPQNAVPQGESFEVTAQLQEVCQSFWIWVDWCSSMFPFGGHSNPSLDNAVESATSNSNFVPKAAFFAVYVPRDTCLHHKTQLRLCCIPTSKRCELNDYEEKLGNILIGDGSSDIPMCSNEKAYVFISEAKKKIDARISDRVCDVVADRFQRGTSWRILAGDLWPKIKDDEINAIEVDRGRCPKECCRAVLQKWSQKYTISATYKELMRCLTNMGLANVNWIIMRELELVKLENIPLSER